MGPGDAAIVAEVRALAGVATAGPDDDHVLAGVRGFVSAFDFWYIRVIAEAVPNYRRLVVARINPFIRRAELDGLSAVDAAQRLVEDYARRNYVTAGGWALEELAIASSETLQKSAAAGVDAQRLDPATNDYHLYVLKSGLVTRNSDIVNAIKTHGRAAERLLRQGRRTGGVTLNYAILAGKTSSTFEDGVHRPSSAEFWADALSLPEDEAVELALAMATVAGKLVTHDASVHIDAMVALIAAYIAKPGTEPAEADWDFIAKRNMQQRSHWAPEDRVRHGSALVALAALGYGSVAEGTGDAALAEESAAGEGEGEVDAEVDAED